MVNVVKRVLYKNKALLLLMLPIVHQSMGSYSPGWMATDIDLKTHSTSPQLLRQMSPRYLDRGRVRVTQQRPLSEICVICTKSTWPGLAQYTYLMQPTAKPLHRSIANYIRHAIGAVYLDIMIITLFYTA